MNAAGNGPGPDAPVTATPAAASGGGSGGTGGGAAGGGGGSGSGGDAGDDAPDDADDTPDDTDDGPPPAVTVSVTALTLDEGGTGNYTLVLDSRPSGPVTIVVTVGGDGRFRRGDGGTGAPDPSRRPTGTGRRR